MNKPRNSTSSMPKTLLDKSIELLGGVNSSPFLEQVKIQSRNIVLDYPSDIVLVNGKSYLEQFSRLSARFKDTINISPRLLTPRLENLPKDEIDIPILLQSAFDTEENVIVDSLQTPICPKENVEKAPAFWSKTLVLLGSVYLSVLDTEYVKQKFSRVLVVETSPVELALSLLLGNLPELASNFRKNNISLQFLLDSSLDKLKAKFRDNTVGLQPTSIFGMTVCRSPVENSELALFNTWLESPEGLMQSVAGAMGKETDEINQLLQSIVNAKNCSNRILATPQVGLTNQPVVLVASGPSLDTSLPWLKKYQKNLQIICSGSSLGSLLAEGIQPSAVVFLERSSVVYETDLLPLVNERIDLSDILLIGSMTIDPRIPPLFSSVIWFHRPLSAAMAFFPEESGAKLLQSGPHSANAALESLLHIGYRSILILGCDFSAQNRSNPRSKNALGFSPRDLNIPVMGRSGKTVYSSASLLDASYYFANSINAYKANISSIKFGVELADIKLELVELDDKTAKSFFNNNRIIFELKNMKDAMSDQEGLQSKISKYSSAVDKYLLTIKNHVNSFPPDKLWNLECIRTLDPLLCVDETGLTAESAFSKRLCRLPITFMMMPLHDANDLNQWTSAVQLINNNIKLMRNFYSFYFNVLYKFVELPVSPFDWSQFYDLATNTIPTDHG